MAEFKVDTDMLRGQASEIRALQDSLNEVALKLTGMQLGSIIRIKASTALIGKVSACKWEAICQAGNLENLAGGLDNIADTYDTTEKKLTEPKTEEQAAAESEREIWEYLIKIFGKATPVTQIISMLYYWFGGDGGVKDYLKGLKSLISATGDVGKLVLDNEPAAEWAKTLTGWKDMAGQSEIMKYSWAAADTVGKKFKVITKWAGVLLTAGVTAVGNYQEFDGDLSNSRFWEETVLETGIELGKGMMASAAVSTALAAAFGTAPVLVVAAGAGLITVVADWACEQLFEKNATESLSDWILDEIHGIVSGAQDRIQGIVSSAKDGVTALWQSITGGTSMLFSGA